MKRVEVSQMDVQHLSVVRNSISTFMKYVATTYTEGTGKLLDIAPQVHEGARHYFPESIEVETLDIDPQSGCTYIGDLCNRNQVLANNSFDYIVCTEVLEHVLQPFHAVQEMWRVLKPNGYLFLTTPFNLRIHGPLPDCWRFTEHGLRALLTQFDLVELNAVDTSDRDLMPIHYTVVARKPALQTASYSPCTPYRYHTFSPWFGQDFQTQYADISTHTVVTEDRCYTLRQLAQQTIHLPGQMAECGVYKGGTAFLLADVMQHSGKELHLFDTFAGMPEDANTDPSGHQTGDFGDTSLEAVQTYLSRFNFIRFFPGRIPETFSLVEQTRYCFVHVDVDLYSSVQDCCTFFYDRLCPGGVMVFDDYGFWKYRDAAKLAVDQFFANKPEVPIVSRTGQCFIFKLP